MRTQILICFTGKFMDKLLNENNIFLVKLMIIKMKKENY